MIALLFVVLASPVEAPVGSLQLSIDDVFDRAARTSEDVDVTRAQIFRSVAEKRRALSEWMPQWNGIASYDRTLHTIYDQSQLEGTPFGQRNSYNLSMSVVESLFSGFSTRSRQKAARANYTSAQIAVASARAQAVYDSTQAYYDALLADELSRIADATYAQADEVYQSTEMSYHAGNTSEFDYLRAKVSRDTQQPTVVQRHVDRDIALLRLKQLLNVPDDQPVVLVSALDGSASPSTVADSGASAAEVGDTRTLERAPVRQARALLEAQQSTLERVKSQNYPQLSANMQYARLAFPHSLVPSWNDFATNWTVGLALSFNFFSGFRIKGDIEYATADVYEASARLRQAEERARLDTFEAEKQLEASKAVLSASAGTVDQAQRAYDIAQLRYAQGVSNQLELTDARVQLQTSKTNRARAARDVQVAAVRVALLPLLPISAQALGQSNGMPRTSTLGVGLSALQQGSQQSMGSTGAPNITANAGTSLSSPSSAQGPR